MAVDAVAYMKEGMTGTGVSVYCYDRDGFGKDVWYAGGNLRQVHKKLLKVFRWTQSVTYNCSK